MMPAIATARTTLARLGHLIALVAGAADALITASLGARPLLPALRRTLRRISSAVRDRMAGVVDAEIVDDPDRKVRP